MITKEPKRIIVADDSEFFRYKLSDILSEAGHIVRIMRNGAELIKEIQTNPYGIDLILLDLQMPNINGFGVLEWVKNNGFQGKVQILAVTGVYETTSAMEKLKEMGVKGLMTKAYTPEQIVFRVNKMLFPEKVGLRTETEPRVPVSIPVDFSVGEATSTGYMLNISATGMFLHSKKSLFPGAVLQMRFTLPGSNSLLKMKGSVRWCTQMGDEKSPFSGAGIQFINPEADDGKTIKKFVDAERKRLGLESR